MPTDNPFYDGAGPEQGRDLGATACATRSARPTTRRPAGCSSATWAATTTRRPRRGQRRRPRAPTTAGRTRRHLPATRAPARSTPMPHNGRDAAVTGGFVYHGTQFPAAYQGSYFFADYTQNWIQRLTFDANGNVTGVFNFEPADGSRRRAVRRHRLPDRRARRRALLPRPRLLRHQRHVRRQQDPPHPLRRRRTSRRSRSPRRNPTPGPAPLTVDFSSAGSADPEGQPLTYSWTFGDGGTSTAANPTPHLHASRAVHGAADGLRRRQHDDRRRRSRSASAAAPTATITRADRRRRRSSPATSSVQRRRHRPRGRHAAGERVHLEHRLPPRGPRPPGHARHGVKSGTFTIPTSGHDFSGNTRYRITLTVTDSTG